MGGYTPDPHRPSKENPQQHFRAAGSKPLYRMILVLTGPVMVVRTGIFVVPSFV